jgi:hypothetical protein
MNVTGAAALLSAEWKPSSVLIHAALGPSSPTVPDVMTGFSIPHSPVAATPE